MLPVLSAVAGSDYSVVSNLRLELGATRHFQLVNVSIINDNTFEMLQKSFVAVLTLDSSVFPAINISPSQANVTIVDDGNTIVAYMFLCQMVVDVTTIHRLHFSNIQVCVCACVSLGEYTRMCVCTWTCSNDESILVQLNYTTIN